MPPSSPPSEHNTSAEDTPPLSDQGKLCQLAPTNVRLTLTSDVAILHQIVTSAQQSTDVEKTPFRAIFAAYDSILAQHGLDPDHDQVYLRFLFRLGDKTLSGRTVYEKFESLLDELGIQVEFDADDDGLQEISRHLDLVGQGEAAAPTQPTHHDVSRGRSRRASFGSIYDAGDESTRVSRQRHGSRISLSRLPIGQTPGREGRPSTKATTRAAERTQSLLRDSRPDHVHRSGLSAHDFASNLRHYRRRNVSRSSNGDLGLQLHGVSPEVHANGRRQSNIQAKVDAQSISDRSLDERSLTQLSEDKQPLYQVPREALYHHSDTQLLRDAITFQHYHVRSIVRDAVSKWRVAALISRNHHITMEETAAAHDAGILMSQGLEHWRLMLHAKRQKQETERFFNHMERRAGKARDLYLLTKAFTHWAQCAADEVQRTSVARRHILRTKYFNAWRDITAVNDLKVRRQRLVKFYGFWKKRSVQTLVDDSRAISVYRENLGETVYWRWFWMFCERRAPEWRAGRLQKKYFSRWALNAQRNLNQQERVTAYRSETMVRTILSQWLEQTRTVLSFQKQAILFRQQRVLANRIAAWQLQTYQAPLARQMSTSVDWRIARSVFATLVARLRAEQLAASVNRLRIMRNIWTNWNDRLRWQTLAHRVDDRIVLQTLYKWVLAERLVLFRRLYEKHLKQRTLTMVSNRWAISRDQRHNSSRMIEDAQIKRCLSSAMTRWKQHTQQQRQHQQLAFEFHAPRVAQEVLNSWLVKVRHVRDLQRWARDANFYFLTTKSIKRWQGAIVEARRQKRRNAYAQIRRRVKMSLARSLFCKWRNQATHVLDLQKKALHTDSIRLLALGTGLFDHWKSRFFATLDGHYQADRFYETNLVHQRLQTWTVQVRLCLEMEKQAYVYAEMHVSNIAFGSLRKLSLRVFELRRREETANSFKEWNQKRHFRSVLRHWQAKAAERNVQASINTAPPLETGHLSPDGRAGDGITGRAEDWTAFDEGFNIGDWIPAVEAQSSTTPLPGYLSTPSKRAARARALVRGSTTPATPKGTPFERRLRSQLASASRTSRRSEFGRSTLGARPGAIEDISENAPRTPGL